jgi:hypothetical protein
MWGRSEIRELGNVLMPDEKIAQAVNGTYEGGFALLCVTTYRVLLVDRKPMMLTIEDVRYDMMSEVDFHNRLFGSTIRIITPMRNMVFNSWSSGRLRKSVNYIQQRVMEIRQHSLGVQQMQGQLVGTPQPLMNMNTVNQQPQLAAPGQVGGVVAPTPTPYAQTNPYAQTPLLLRRRRFPSFY